MTEHPVVTGVFPFHFKAMMDVDEMFVVKEEVIVDPEELVENTMRKREKKKEKKRRWRRKKRERLKQNEKLNVDEEDKNIKNEERSESSEMKIQTEQCTTLKLFQSNVSTDGFSAKNIVQNSESAEQNLHDQYVQNDSAKDLVNTKSEMEDQDVSLKTFDKPGEFSSKKIDLIGTCSSESIYDQNNSRSCSGVRENLDLEASKSDVETTSALESGDLRDEISRGSDIDIPDSNNSREVDFVVTIDQMNDGCKHTEMNVVSSEPVSSRTVVEDTVMVAEEAPVDQEISSSEDKIDEQFDMKGQSTCEVTERKEDSKSDVVSQIILIDKETSSSEDKKKFDLKEQEKENNSRNAADFGWDKNIQVKTGTELTIRGIMEEVKKTQSELEEAGSLIGKDENTNINRPFSILQGNVLAMEFDEGSQDSGVFDTIQNRGEGMIGVQSVTLHHRITYGLEETRDSAKQRCESMVKATKHGDGEDIGYDNGAGNISGGTKVERLMMIEESEKVDTGNDESDGKVDLLKDASKEVGDATQSGEDFDHETYDANSGSRANVCSDDRYGKALVHFREAMLNKSNVRQKTDCGDVNDDNGDTIDTTDVGGDNNVSIDGGDQHTTSDYDAGTDGNADHGSGDYGSVSNENDHDCGRPVCVAEKVSDVPTCDDDGNFEDSTTSSSNRSTGDGSKDGGDNTVVCSVHDTNEKIKEQNVDEKEISSAIKGRVSNTDTVAGKETESCKNTSETESVVEITKQENVDEKEEGELSSSSDEENLEEGKDLQGSVKKYKPDLEPKFREKKSSVKTTKTISKITTRASEQGKSDRSDESKGLRFEKGCSRRDENKDKPERRKLSLSKETKSDKDKSSSYKRDGSNTRNDKDYSSSVEKGSKDTSKSRKTASSKEKRCESDNTKITTVKRSSKTLDTLSCSKDSKTKESTTKTKSISTKHDKTTNDKKATKSEEDNGGKAREQTQKAKECGVRSSRSDIKQQKGTAKQESRKGSGSSTRNSSRSREKKSDDDYITNVKVLRHKTSLESLKDEVTSKTTSRKSSAGSESSNKRSLKGDEELIGGKQSKDMKPTRMISEDRKSGSSDLSVKRKTVTDKEKKVCDREVRKSDSKSAIVKTKDKTNAESKNKKSQVKKREDVDLKCRENATVKLEDAKKRVSCSNKDNMTADKKGEGDKNPEKKDSFSKEGHAKEETKSGKKKTPKGTQKSIEVIVAEEDNKNKISDSSKEKLSCANAEAKKKSVSVKQKDICSSGSKSGTASIVKSETAKKAVSKKKLTIKEYKSRNRSQSKLESETTKTSNNKSRRVCEEAESLVQSKSSKEPEKLQEMKSKTQTQNGKSSEEKLLGKRKREDTPVRSGKVRKTTKSSKNKDSFEFAKTKGATIPGNVLNVRILKVDRGKALVLKKRHVNQLFIRGDNIIMVAYDSVVPSEIKL